MKLDTKAFEAKMQKLITGYEAELDTIRVGRANPNVLSKIKVDYWGMSTPVNQVGEVKVADARTIIITPWESNMLKVVEKAINESDLGIPPQNDGKCIRLAFPALTGEKRKEISKDVTKMGEAAKVAVRNIRREANDKIKAMKKASEITEDEQKTSEKEVQDLTDKYTKQLDKVTEAKTKEIMEI
jgi:ribosome recycling factor